MGALARIVCRRTGCLGDGGRAEARRGADVDGIGTGLAGEVAVAVAVGAGDEAGKSQEAHGSDGLSHDNERKGGTSRAKPWRENERNSRTVEEKTTSCRSPRDIYLQDSLLDSGTTRISLVYDYYYCSMLLLVLPLPGFFVSSLPESTTYVGAAQWHPLQHRAAGSSYSSLNNASSLLHDDQLKPAEDGQRL